MLTKSYRYELIPGTAEVPYVAPYTVCQRAPATGHYETELVLTSYLLYDVSAGIGYSYSTAGMDSWTVRDADNGDIYLDAYRFVSTWVQDTAGGQMVCTTYPGQAYVAYVPSTTKTTLDVGWDAGAISVDSQPGDCEVTFTMGDVVGARVGLEPSASDSTSLEVLTHALYFYQDGASNVYVVVESGQAMTPPAAYAFDDAWAIRRVGALVTYWCNGALVYQSAAPSAGELQVGGRLYSSGDTIA
jgi:hypothetical protein